MSDAEADKTKPPQPTPTPPKTEKPAAGAMTGAEARTKKKEDDGDEKKKGEGEGGGDGGGGGDEPVSPLKRTMSDTTAKWYVFFVVCIFLDSHAHITRDAPTQQEEADARRCRVEDPDAPAMEHVRRNLQGRRALQVIFHQ